MALNTAPAPKPLTYATSLAPPWANNSLLGSRSTLAAEGRGSLGAIPHFVMPRSRTAAIPPSETFAATDNRRWATGAS